MTERGSSPQGVDLPGVPGLSLRPWAETDSPAALTSFLHRAYADLLRRGLRFTATHQDAAHTAARIAAGQCWIAEIEGELSGTVIYRSPERASGCPFFDRPDVAELEQLAVVPELRGRGVASALLDKCEQLAQDDGARELALDTAEPAADLCAYYGRHGYRFVDFVQWGDTNYRSVVLSKRLGPRPRRTDEGRFVCDAMLGGLARWLRAAGHDAEFEHGIDDAALVARAGATGRILLSSDSGIFERTVVRSGTVPSLWVPRALDKHQQLAFVLDVFDLATREPPRCMDCGGTLAQVPKESVRDEAPPRTFEMHAEFWRCSVCGKLLWHGTHWQHIAARLAAAAR